MKINNLNIKRITIAPNETDTWVRLSDHEVDRQYRTERGSAGC
jgi:hypothetical protein